jgi:Tfp pilus assembly protein PilV
MRFPSPSRGTTLTELLVALVLLGAGVLLAAGVAATSERLLGDGRRASRGGILVERRLELLRAASARAGGCALGAGTDSAADGVTLAWQLGDLGPSLRRLAVVARRPSPAGPRADTVVTWVRCE